MGELTPRNKFPYPSEREQPFWDSFKANALAVDAAIYANADNGNLMFIGGGIAGWNASTGILFWTEEVHISGFHTPFRAVLPPGSIEIQPNEVIFFQMPRLLQANTTVQLYRGSKIFLEGARLHDLRIYAVRVDDTIYFGNGLSLTDGQTGPVFGAGLYPAVTTLPHKHEPAWVFTAPGPGIFTLNPVPVITAPDLVRVDVFRNGILLVEGVGEDYTVDLNTGTITLAVPTVVVPNPDRFVVWRETRDFSVSVSGHEHPPKLVFNPIPGTTVLNALASAPFLLRVDLFRNGLLQVEGPGDDFTVDLNTGLITLVTPSTFGDKFEIHRHLAVAT